MNRRQLLMGLVGLSAAAAATAEAAGTIPNAAALSETDAEYSILMRAMVRRGMFPAPGRKWRHRPRLGRR